MSRISRLISALCGDDYKAAEEIYKEIKAKGTQIEIQNATKAFKVI